MATAAILSITAILKVEQLWTDPGGERALMGSSVFDAVLIDVEFLAAAALLGKIRPSLVRRGVLLLFCGFLCVSVAKLADGAPSCGCTGHGEIPPAGARSFALRLRNPHHAPVEVAAVESSCPCVVVQRVPFRLGPGEETKLELTLDLSRAPDFSGPLFPDITGKTASGVVSFVARIAARVRAPD